MEQLAIVANRARARTATLLLLLDRGLVPDGRSPGRLPMWSALGVEVGILLWLSVGVAVQWAITVPLALAVAGVLALEMRRGIRGPDRRPWPLALALGLSLAINIVMTAFLAFVLFLVVVQGALAGKGILPIIIVPLLVGFAAYLKVGLPLLLALTLVMILDLGVLMESGPVAFLAVPLVISIGVTAVLFQALSPGSSRGLHRLPGDKAGPRGVDGPW